MKGQKQEVQSTDVKGSESLESLTVSFDKNVEDLLNHLGSLIGEILIAEILSPKSEQKKESEK